MFVNAYLVETEHGVVAVDSTLTNSDSKALRQQLDALKKPLLAVLLTHGHPDHYNGVTTLSEGTGAPVIATEKVDAIIRQYDAAKEAQWRPMFGAEWPDKRTFPSRIAKDGETIALDGVRFTVHDLGAGESHADAYWVLEEEDAPHPRAAFIGDAVFNGAHSYLADGHIDEWLANLDRLERELSGVAQIYPGHGAAGGPELFAVERDYLRTYRDTVRELAHGETKLDDAAKAELVRRMKVKLPTDKLEFMIAFGADPVAAEISKK